MRKNKMFEINGQRYVTPGVFARWCGCSTQKITAACKDGRVIGACKDSSSRWIIPADTLKPLDAETIRKLMVLTLYLKNRPTQKIDFADHNMIVAVYTYLQRAGYIEAFNETSNRIPYEVILSEKGMKVATEGLPLTINWLKIGSTVIQVAASILTIIQACN